MLPCPLSDPWPAAHPSSGTIDEGTQGDQHPTGEDRRQEAFPREAGRSGGGESKAERRHEIEPPRRAS